MEEKRISRRGNTDVENHERRALHIKSYHRTQKKSAYGKHKKWSHKKQDEEVESNKKKNVKCFSCNELDHISRHCQEAKQGSTSETAINLENWALSVN